MKLLYIHIYTQTNLTVVYKNKKQSIKYVYLYTTIIIYNCTVQTVKDESLRIYDINNDICPEAEKISNVAKLAWCIY